MTTSTTKKLPAQKSSSAERTKLPSVYPFCSPTIVKRPKFNKAQSPDKMTASPNMKSTLPPVATSKSN